MMKYQVIVSVPAGTDMDVLSASAPVFTGLSQLLEMAPEVSHRRMPGTRDFNGEMLCHFEVKAVEAIDQVMHFLATGIGAAMAQTWTVIAAQTTFKQKQYDVNSDPVMIDSGEVDENNNPIMVHEQKVNVAIPLSESYFLDFMPDVPIYDAAGETIIGTERPTVATPHQMAGAEPWQMVA